MFVTSVLESEQQLAENPWEVCPIDLIDDQKELHLGKLNGLLHQLQEHSLLDLIGEVAPLVHCGSNPLDEILIGVGGVELDDLDCTPVITGQKLSERLGDECLPSTGWTLE